MSILENFRDRFSGAVDTARKASSEFIEVSRINSAIRSEEEKIKNLKCQIGNIVYDSYLVGKPIDSELVSICEEIGRSQKIIEVLKNRILEVRNLVKCQGCSTTFDREVAYCPQCGIRLDMVN